MLRADSLVFAESAVEMDVSDMLVSLKNVKIRGPEYECKVQDCLDHPVPPQSALTHFKYKT